MKMTNLGVLNADEIFKLVDYIQKFAPEGEDKKQFALAHLSDFFIDTTIEEEIELFQLVEARDYFSLHEFIKNHPMLKVNLDGDSKQKQHSGAEAKEIALNTTYNLAKQSKLTTQSKQMIAARELSCLKTIKEYPYTFSKMKMMQEHGNAHVLQSLKMYEEQLEPYNLKRFLSLVFTYFRKNPKQTTFLEYVFYYLDVIRLDTENKSELKKEYLNKVNELYEYFDSIKQS